MHIATEHPAWHSVHVPAMQLICIAVSDGPCFSNLIHTIFLIANKRTQGQDPEIFTSLQNTGSDSLTNESCQLYIINKSKTQQSYTIQMD